MCCVITKSQAGHECTADHECSVGLDRSMSVAAHMLSFNDNATSVLRHLAAAENVNFNALALVSDKADNSQACNGTPAQSQTCSLKSWFVGCLHQYCVTTATLHPCCTFATTDVHMMHHTLNTFVKLHTASLKADSDKAHLCNFKYNCTA